MKRLVEIKSDMGPVLYPAGRFSRRESMIQSSGKTNAEINGRLVTNLVNKSRMYIDKAVCPNLYSEDHFIPKAVGHLGSRNFQATGGSELGRCGVRVGEQ